MSDALLTHGRDGMRFARENPTSDPIPGHYKLKLVRGGPWVPARIIHEPPRDPVTGESLDRSYYWSAEINGVVGGASLDFRQADGLLRVWNDGILINKTDYDLLVATKTWAETHAPEMPEANPGAKIDLNKIPPLF